MAKKKEPETGIEVIADRPCFYNNIYRKEGDKFFVEKESQIGKAMIRVGSEKAKAPKVPFEDGKIKEIKQPETIKEAGKVI